MGLSRSYVIVLVALSAACSSSGESPGKSPGGSVPGGVNGDTSSSSAMGGAGSTASGSGSSTCVMGIPATSQIPRLTNAQYDHTVRDLLGVTSLKASGDAAPSSILATDQAGSLTSLGWSSYDSVAKMISAQVMADPAVKSRFLSCATSDPSCLHNTVVSFGRRAFRRPLSQEEVAAFDAIIAKGAQITKTGAPDEIAEALLYLFLISPSFLQRAEITETSDGSGHFTLSSYEVASRLSYLLWGSAPDDVLNLAADNNELTTPAQLKAQAERMLAMPQARDMVGAFHRSYLLMGTNTRWDNADRDPTLFPQFSKALVPVLSQETQKFFDYIVFDQKGTLADLLLSPIAFVNAATAPLYGLDPAKFGNDLTQVELDRTQRPGFLTRLGFLNAYSAYNRTSPILRGAFITKQVLAVPIGAPPPGAEATPLPATADLDTNRKQVDQQTSAAACATCHHNFINPPGFAMEAFDAAGRWQTKEAATQIALDTTADVMLDGKAVHVTGPADLMTAIATSAAAQRSYATKWVAYAYERPSNANDACLVDSLSQKLTMSGYNVLNLIADLTQTETFQKRVVEVP
jgi:hypothetical protein